MEADKVFVSQPKQHKNILADILNFYSNQFN